ncbi:hypothetical protein D3C75_1032060 [compost metagenome]
MDLGGRQRIFWQPVAIRRIAFHQVHHDGVAVGQYLLIGQQYRDLPNGIKPKERLALAHRGRGFAILIRQIEHP